MNNVFEQENAPMKNVFEQEKTMNIRKLPSAGQVVSPDFTLYRDTHKHLVDYVNTDRSKAALLLWFLTVTCSCCPYLSFGSPIILLTKFSKF